ncbi:ABC transporter ATP-binding protein [Bosea sp. PAMC 26642]|uniref:ABC transporter ATP-binding protein n=1 Tax=Bosea sp. (strain PAMC 26642) TaxID=1792307 RepID=UPI00076FF8F3|nr:ABC transporter ATP-binding protein [Bosea sp. PAMC 26642]AMJ61957.1 spermidine/putrescine ABC transporter ATP-binding protein [Bosea sp. PAMC 26642]
MQEIKLDLVGISKAYGPVIALHPTSLSVRKGEFLTLLGPSGSGKTTLLQILAGLTTPAAGQILVDGRDVTSAPPYQRDIGMVFQNYALFPHLTVADNIAFPLKMRKVPAAEISRRVEEILSVVSLPQVADRFPHELSGGQQQRIAFSRATVFRPSVVLMDEPLGALDKKLREQMQIEIVRIHKQLETTIVYVTHDQEEAMVMSDRICLMNNGSIEQLGTPDEIYDRPSTVFAADFIGTSNILRGRISAAAGEDISLVVGHGVTVAATARPGQRFAVGDEAALSVRPEHITVSPQCQDGRPQVQAVVEGGISTGAVQKKFFKLANGTTFVSAALNGAIASSVEQGQSVWLSWNPSTAQLLPASAESE